MQKKVKGVCFLLTICYWYAVFVNNNTNITSVCRTFVDKAKMKSERCEEVEQMSIKCVLFDSV